MVEQEENLLSGQWGAMAANDCLQLEKRQENLLSGRWGAMAANDCLQLEKGQEMATKYIFEELIERHEMGNEDNIKLIDTYSLQVDGSIGELYLARCRIKTMGSYCGILWIMVKKEARLFFRRTKGWMPKAWMNFMI